MVVFLLAKVLRIFSFIVAAVDVGRPLFSHFFYLLSASCLVSERILFVQQRDCLFHIDI